MTKMAKTGQAFKTGSPSIHHCMIGEGDFRCRRPADARETIAL